MRLTYAAVGGSSRTVSILVLGGRIMKASCCLWRAFSARGLGETRSSHARAMQEDLHEDQDDDAVVCTWILLLKPSSCGT